MPSCIRVFGTSLIAVVLCLGGCSASSITAIVEGLDVGETAAAAPRDQVRVDLERVVAARWSVPLSGLLDLEHERAVAAGLTDRDEPIEIAVFVIDHPIHGRYLIDSGVAAAFRRGPRAAGVSRLVGWVMGADRLEVLVSTAELGAVNGVFLTHMHMDHVMGLPDVPADVPVFVGPREPEAEKLDHIATRGTIDRLVQASRDLRAWPLEPDPDGRFSGRVDVFGDGSVIGLHVPGHTPGSMAFAVRAEDGEHLILGDASHTAWGWENGVPPGSYTMDAARGAESLAQLRALADEHPDWRLHPGHQQLASD